MNLPFKSDPTVLFCSRHACCAQLNPSTPSDTSRNPARVKGPLFQKRGRPIDGNHSLRGRSRWSRADRGRTRLIRRLTWRRRRARRPCTRHKVCTAGASPTARAWSASPTAKVPSPQHASPFSLHICFATHLTALCVIHHVHSKQNNTSNPQI